MILTTTPSVEGRQILEYKGIIFGEVISGVDVLRDFTAGLSNFFGGRSGAYEEELTNARETALRELADGKDIALVVTTGGTGFSPTDLTPEATLSVVERPAPGIAEAMRWQSLQITPRAMLSRAASVIRGKTLIINLPGSPKAVREALEFLLPQLGHGLEVLRGTAGECGRK